MLTVLVVEDEQLLLRGLVRQLNWAQCGCEVIAQARNGREGLECITAHRPDIVITDIRMPIMDGLKMLQEARPMYDFEAIILSGHSDFAYARAALTLGAADYILKPVDMAALEQALKKISARRVKTAQTMAAQVQDLLASAPNMMLSGSAVANFIGVSSDHLSRLIKRETGLTLRELMTKIRMEHAAELLCTAPSLKVYEVALRVGFEDYKYFHTVFTRYFGASPSQYKHKARDD